MRSCTRAHPPTVRACAHLFCGNARLRPTYYRGPDQGRAARPWGLPPASADPDRTHFTTLTIRNDESPRPPAIRRRPPGRPHADGLRAVRMQTASGPSACRRPPSHPHADDTVKTDTSETFHNKGTAPYVVGNAPYVASKHVAVAIGTVAV